MPIVRRSDCVLLPMVFCPVYSCCDAGESGGEMCAALWRGCCFVVVAVTVFVSIIGDTKLLNGLVSYYDSKENIYFHSCQHHVHRTGLLTFILNEHIIDGSSCRLPKEGRYRHVTEMSSCHSVSQYNSWKWLRREIDNPDHTPVKVG
jgi:hypothetical protein